MGNDSGYLMELFLKIQWDVCKMFSMETSRVKFYGICLSTNRIHKDKENIYITIIISCAKATYFL